MNNQYFSDKEFKAVDIFPLIEGHKATIESVCIWGKDKLLVGTYDGELKVFNIQYDPNNKKKFLCTLNSELTQPKFSKRSVTQMCVLEELGILLCICDGMVRIHSLFQDFQEIDTLGNKSGKHKQCNVFCLKKSNETYSLAIASTKRRLYVHELNTRTSRGYDFAPLQELVLPEEARSLSWSGDWVCVGFKKQYLMLHSANGQSKTLFNSGSNTNTISLTIPSEEIIVTRDVVGLTVDFDGKPTRRYGLIWNEIPTTLAWMKPYILAPLKDVVEIRMLRASKGGTLIQALPIPGIITTSQENYIDLDTHQLNGLREMLKTVESDDEFDYKQRVFLASKSKVYVMCMKQFPNQIKQYVKLGLYDDALVLAEELKTTEHVIDPEIMKDIHVDFAFNLVKQGDFRGAMNQFIETSIDPRNVICMIPGLLTGTFDSEYPITRELSKMFDDETIKNKALTAMIPFLLGSREKYAKSSEDDKNAMLTAEAVDTALLKAYLVGSATLLVAFLKVPNRCNLEASEAALKAAKKWVEVVIFFKSKGQHQTALEMLKLHSVEDGSLKGIRPTIEYLQTIDDKALILEYAKWVMLKDPQEGLEIFIRENLPLVADEVLGFLENKTLNLSPLALMKLKMNFLEKIIKKSTESGLHNSMILFYLQILGFDNYTEKEAVREKLRVFLNESKHYKADKVLAKFASDDFSEERAILLSRVNQHAQALQIYIKMKKPEMAEKYCEEHYGKRVESKDIFFLLIQSHIQSQPPNMSEAIRIMEKHAEKIDCTLVLKELPSEMYLGDLVGYFEKSLRHLNDKRREVQIVQNLAKSENIQVRSQLTRERQRSMQIKQGKLCPVCNKIIGNRVFYWYPNGVVVHVMCIGDVSTDPISGFNFAKDFNLRHGKHTPSKDE